MNRDEAPCREVVELLTDYLEGALPVSDRAALEQHLLLCEPCAVFLHQMRTTIRLTGRLREQAVPDEVVSRLTRLVEEVRDR